MSNMMRLQARPAMLSVMNVDGIDDEVHADVVVEC